MIGGTASAAASSAERTSSPSPPASARYSLTIPSTASADAVDPTISAHHDRVGAQVCVSATIESAARAHRWGTQSVASGGGTPNGFRTRSASELATRTAVVRVASFSAVVTRTRACADAGTVTLPVTPASLMPWPSPSPIPRAARGPRAPSATARRSGRTGAAGGSRPSSRSRPAGRRPRRWTPRRRRA